MQFTDRQKKLFAFVQEFHGEQKRKYTGEPYWTHLLGVAELVSDVTDLIKDRQWNPGRILYIEIALCHDLFEDTPCTFIQLFPFLDSIGYESDERDYIIRGVEALTDQFTSENYPDMNRKQRKAAECQRLATIPYWAQTVKYADMVHNTSSILEHDKNFAVIYLAEKKRALNAMRLGNIDLLVLCCHTLFEAENKLLQYHLK